MIHSGVLTSIFNIKIWETEEDRIQGEPIILDEIYHDLKDAVARLKKIMSRQDYAFAEIINEIIVSHKS